MGSSDATAYSRRWPPCRLTTRSRAPNDGPALVDAVVNRTELAMPPAVTLEMAKGFTLYMVKAVMSGRGDEVIDLARSNLWR